MGVSLLHISEHQLGAFRHLTLRHHQVSSEVDDFAYVFYIDWAYLLAGAAGGAGQISSSVTTSPIIDLVGVFAGVSAGFSPRLSLMPPFYWQAIRGPPPANVLSSYE